jgi:hypothetical protein
MIDMNNAFSIEMHYCYLIIFKSQRYQKYIFNEPQGGTLFLAFGKTMFRWSETQNITKVRIAKYIILQNRKI